MATVAYHGYECVIADRNNSTTIGAGPGHECYIDIHDGATSTSWPITVIIKPCSTTADVAL